jgi:biopolymer transport protein ExbD/biopolymer transport protein TolR
MAMDVGQSGGRKGMAQPNMNVTPLVDVVLVLLIIFMVITPLLAKQFWIHLPNKPEQEQPVDADDKNKPLVVTLTESGDIRINRDVVPKAQFAATLRRVLAARQERTVFFDAEDNAEFGNAVEALDLARGGGASTIAVLTDPLAH